MTSRTEYSTKTPKKSTLFSGQYLHNHSTLDIGVLGYIGIVRPKEHSPEVMSFPPGTPCIYNKSKMLVVLRNINGRRQLLSLSEKGNCNHLLDQNCKRIQLSPFFHEINRFSEKNYVGQAALSTRQLLVYS
jgi:hypothetical protein